MGRHIIDWWFLYVLLGLIIFMALGGQHYERNKTKIHGACVRQQKVNIAAGINPDKDYYECHPYFELLAEKNKACFEAMIECYDKAYNPTTIQLCQNICKDELRK